MEKPNIELIVRMSGRDALYIIARPNKKEGYTVGVRSPVGTIKSIGSMTVDEETNMATLMRQVAELIENQEYRQ